MLARSSPAMRARRRGRRSMHDAAFLVDALDLGRACAEADVGQHASTARWCHALAVWHGQVLDRRQARAGYPRSSIDADRDLTIGEREFGGILVDVAQRGDTDRLAQIASVVTPRCSGHDRDCGLIDDFRTAEGRLRRAAPAQPRHTLHLLRPPLVRGLIELATGSSPASSTETSRVAVIVAVLRIERLCARPAILASVGAAACARTAVLDSLRSRA